MKVKKLSEEQIAEAANCKTIEEKLDFLSKNMVPLSPEMLDQISGGSGEDDYYICVHCKAKFEHWYDMMFHAMRHLGDY
ncbi:hypothetical protein [Pseudobutyrivibrio sp. MD2005]|uniref:hypothetical protein n=1 Tax=Pseudobutyrivibrio sp. MD2005 TaxID=1410616 RepID=UPI0004845A24|nr:hypothetical protein [Pseudobutyrivibrio sp. MD2005]